MQQVDNFRTPENIILSQRIAVMSRAELILEKLEFLSDRFVAIENRLDQVESLLKSKQDAESENINEEISLFAPLNCENQIHSIFDLGYEGWIASIGSEMIALR